MLNVNVSITGVIARQGRALFGLALAQRRAAPGQPNITRMIEIIKP
jgi:hypothetical protein